MRPPPHSTRYVCDGAGRTTIATWFHLLRVMRWIILAPVSRVLKRSMSPVRQMSGSSNTDTFFFGSGGLIFSRL